MSGFDAGLGRRAGSAIVPTPANGTGSPGGDRPTSGSAGEIAKGVHDLLAGIVETAEDDPGLGERLRGAGTVAIHFTDAEDQSLTLLLDRLPIEMVVHGDPDADADIALAGSAATWQAIWGGAADLPMAIVDGEVTCRGPVRRFLRTAPIMRSLAREQDGGAVGGGSTAGGEDSGSAALADDEPTATPLWDPGEKVGPSGGQPMSRSDAAALLDQAAEYSYHTGSIDWQEENPGDFWSIRCRDVYKSFGRNKVLNGLNLGVPEGMITVVLGPSGTGKSVLVNHLIGLLFPDRGDILVHGRSVPKLHLSELLELRRKFGVLFQDGALFGSMSVYDNVAFPLRQHTNKDEDEIASIVMARLADVGLDAAGDRMPAELSGGMRKRAGFARALVMEPEIVIFDEPDSGLDPVRTALLCQLIKRIHDEHGGTYIVITHDIASARRIGEYIAVLWKGRIVDAGDAQKMFASENPFVRQFLKGDPTGPLGME